MIGVLAIVAFAVSLVLHVTHADIWLRDVFWLVGFLLLTVHVVFPWSWSAWRRTN